MNDICKHTHITTHFILLWYDTSVSGISVLVCWINMHGFHTTTIFISSLNCLYGIKTLKTIYGTRIFHEKRTTYMPLCLDAYTGNTIHSKSKCLFAFTIIVYIYIFIRIDSVCISTPTLCAQINANNEIWNK